MRPELWMDSENGGLDPEVHSPLDFGFLAVKEGKIVDRLRLQIRTETMVVTREALRVNKCDLLQDGLDLVDARDCYIKFMNRNFFEGIVNGKWKRDRPNKENMPFFCGHNTEYDRPFLKKLVGEFDYAYYHRIDTMVFANILLSQGFLPGIENLKLETISNYLALPPPKRFHDALCDVEQTYLVYQDLRAIMCGALFSDIRAKNTKQPGLFDDLGEIAGKK